MALKFLNKKGWHTGSLRNIENVWKAEQKHEAEQKKLEELRKQIQEERERSEFRLLQEQAGLVPRQERLEFLYDSGLAVGKGANSSGGGSGIAFQALEDATLSTKKTSDTSSASAAAAASQSSAPGALFEDKPHSGNDAWRKLHSDPLLLIRQREQEALARIKNNPVQMALIRKSAEANKEGKSDNKKEHRKKKSSVKAKHHKQSSSEEQSGSENVRYKKKKIRDNDNRRRSKYDDHYHKVGASYENSSERESKRRKNSYRGSKKRDLSHDFSDLKAEKNYGQGTIRKNYDKLKSTKDSLEDQTDSHGDRIDRKHRSSTLKMERETRNFNDARSYDSSVTLHYNSNYRRHKVAPKLSEEEQAARLQEMQVDAELHEEQRWKRLKKADEDDAQEAKHANIIGGRNFLDVAHRSVYGTEKGGSSTIEESVRRRTHYSQGRSEVGDGNAFRR